MRLRLALVCFVACAACSDAQPREEEPGLLIEDTGTFDISGFYDFGRPAFDTAYVTPDAPTDVPAPPLTRCDTADETGADSGLCDPPRSVCADAWWLVYFTDGRCVRGVCWFEKALKYCEEGCYSGGCRTHFTAT